VIARAGVHSVLFGLALGLGYVSVSASSEEIQGEPASDEPLNEWPCSLESEGQNLCGAEIEWEPWLELAELVEPEALSHLTYWRVLARFYAEGREPPQEWLDQIERNLGDSLLLMLPEELKAADVWGLEHGDLLRIRNPMQNAMGEVLESMGPLMAISYLPGLLENDSHIVRRVAQVLRLQLAPSLAHFEQTVASGVSPALLAAEADWDLVQALTRSGLEAEASGELVSFVENLDCYSLLRFSDTAGIPEAEGGPTASALRSGVEVCRE